MTRRGASLAAVLTAGAATILPVPPIPPANGPSDRAAPVPSQTLEAPGADQPGSVRLAPEFFSLDNYNQSGGYTPGSRIEELPGHRQPVRAGLGLSIPLQ